MYFGGGYGHDHDRNREVLAHLQQAHNLDIIAPLQDGPRDRANPYFSVTCAGVSRVLSRGETLRAFRGSPVDLSVSHYQQDRAAKLLAQLEDNGHQQVDGIFQSADALNGVLALHEQPERFRNVVLAYPAGLKNQKRYNPSLTEPRPDGLLPYLNNSEPEHRFDFPKRSVHDRMRLMRSTGSFVVGVSAMLSYQMPLLSEARRKEQAPNVMLVLGTNDIIAPPERVIGSLLTPHDIDLVLVTDTPHGIRGDAATIAHIVRLLPQLEETRGQSTSGEPPKPLADRIHFSPSVSQKRRSILLSVAEHVDLAA